MSAVAPAKPRALARRVQMPVEYDSAVKALAACVTFDEAKYWDDKSEALAAWAKIFHSNDALLKAKRLKLHAYRRMGEIANELRPIDHKRGNTGAGRLPGPAMLLQDNGLNRTAANAARRLALLSDSKFERLLTNPKAPATVAWKLWNTNPKWQEFSHSAMAFRSMCRRMTPAEVAGLLDGKDNYLLTARELVTELTEWLDDFDQRLGRRK